ncbi:MAG: class I SAM-dependent methyltransferase [Candidatus Omnitrophica bacterium]|nr:class I SAM-dependent methyltransferase [Candidatus Omnitrophota bacterium]
MDLFDRYYKKYDAWYEKNRFAYLSEIEAIKKVLPQKGKGLEIGVGSGRFASALNIAYGVDPSKKMLIIARERGIQVKEGRGENLPYQNKEFDFVLIAITICFVKNPKKVICEARRALRNRGRLILAIVDKDSFLGRFYQTKKSIFYKEANFFSVNEIINLLKDAGFSKFSIYQTIFHLPQKVKKIERPKPGYGQGGFVVIGAYKNSS